MNSDRRLKPPSLAGRRVVVTGAGGFLGSHLVRRLVHEGAVVSALVRSKMERALGRLVDVYGVIGLHRVDLEDRRVLRPVVRRVNPDYVFHLAGRVDLARSAEITEACLRENVLATTNLLWALEGLSLSAFVFTSTAEVYGRNPVPFHEGQVVDPPSPYAVSKIAAEQLCSIFARTNGYPIVVLRLSTVYGPHQAEARLIPSVILAILEGRQLKLTSGEQGRDFVYVEDIIEGLLRAGTAPAARGETINLGGNRTVGVREVVDTIRCLLSTSWQPSYGKIPRRAGEPLVWNCRSDKAKRLLGWEPTTALEDGLRTTIEAYRNSLVSRSRRHPPVSQLVSP